MVISETSTKKNLPTLLFYLLEMLLPSLLCFLLLTVMQHLEQISFLLMMRQQLHVNGHLFLLLHLLPRRFYGDVVITQKINITQNNY